MDTTLAVGMASCLVLTALVESSPRVRLPLGLLLAIVLLVSGLDLLPVVLLGALGGTLGRWLMAIDARRGRERERATRTPGMLEREQALRDRLAGSPAFGRLAFSTAALPFVPSSFLFSLLGAMRAPLAPALVGSLFGLVPMLAITTSIFRQVGLWLAGDSGTEPAVPLAIFAIVLLAFRSAALVDWDHHRNTGAWRMREPRTMFSRMGGARIGEVAGATGAHGFGGDPARLGTDDRHEGDDGDVIEGEVLGEELDADAPGDQPGG